MRDKRGPSLVQGDVRRTIVRLAVPMMFALVSMLAFNIVDTMYVGWLGADELAAMSFTFPVVYLVSSIGLGIGTGATSVVSRAIGRGMNASVRRIASDTLMLGIILSVTIATVGVLTVGPVFELLGAPPHLRGPIRDYMWVWYIGLPFVIVPMLGNFIIRATGDMRTPMWIMLIAVGVNAVLDPLLIFGPGPFPRLELQGAALATVISQALTLVAAVLVLRHRKRVLSGWEFDIGRTLTSWKEVLKMGVPSAFINLLAPVNTAAITLVVSAYGVYEVAGFGAATRLEALAIMPLIAVGTSMLTFAGQNMGAGRTYRVSAASRFSFRLMVGYGLIAYVILVLTSPITARLFSSRPEVIGSYIDYIIFADLGFFMLGTALLVSSTFTGMGRPFPSAVINLLRLIVLQLPLALLGSALLGLKGVYIGIAVGNVMMGTAAYLWLRSSLESKAKVRPLPDILAECRKEEVKSALFSGRECR
jgi:putative MATE family efflux protein